METGGSHAYVRCQNCGRFVAMTEAHARHYCSEECAIRYAVCVTCGKYFRQQTRNDVVYCSSECAATYDVPINPRIRDLLEEVS